MYTIYAGGTHAQFWFDDYDEWVNVKDQIEDVIDTEHLGMAFCVDYMPESIEQIEFCGELILPEKGRCCIFVMDATDFDRVESIVKSECEEWKYISENNPNYAKTNP